MFRLTATVALLAAATTSAASAQLRPLEAIPWTVFQNNTLATAEAGASRLYDQRASLAGTSGTLTEIGNFSLTARTGRVAVEASGTIERVFHDQSRFAEPLAGVVSPGNNRRHDSGDYRISTSLRFTPDGYPVTGVVRFGTALPTTTDAPGLDRNATDFFTTLGAAAQRSNLDIQGEAGFSINGTREPFRQHSLFVYDIRAGMSAGPWTPSVESLGQVNSDAASSIGGNRGVESLGELRIGIRYGRRNWLKVELVRGYTTFSPSSGILFSTGIRI